LDAGLVAIVDRALAFEKTARWPDATSMRTALDALRPQGTEEIFGSDSFVPLAYEQNTQDESKAPAGPTSMFVKGAGRRRGESSRRKGRSGTVYAVGTAVSLAFVTGGWLLRPMAAAPPLPSRQLEAARENAASVDTRVADSREVLSAAESDPSAAVAATGVSLAPSKLPAMPVNLRAGKSERRRGGSGGSVPNVAEPVPSEAAVQTPRVTLDPLDRR
jgi:hypothetical protein